MKALFLCAGKGTRMRPISYSVPKHLIPVGNKPVLQRNVEMVLRAGINDIGMVVSPSTKDLYREYLGKKKWGADFHYIEQNDPKGLAHAVQCGRDFVGEEPFLVYLGDNLLGLELNRMINEYRESSTDASILLKSVSNPERFGVAKVEEDNVTGLVEKPEDPPSNLAIVGVYLLNSKIFDAIEEIDFSARGELEITDAIQQLIDWDYRVKFSSFDGWWVDVGRPGDAIKANKVLVQEMSARTDRAVKVNTSLKNPESVIISENAELENCELVGPTVIGDSVISDSKIGPNVSIGDNCNIEDSRISDTIVMKGVKLSGGGVTKSLIGEEVELNLPSGDFEIRIGNQGTIKLR